LPDSLKSLKKAAKILDISLKNIPITFDSGFDNEENIFAIYRTGMIPIIKPNFRNTQDRALIDARNDFFEDIKNLYKTRKTIERSFAWEDVYRKLVIRYERLQSIFTGFRYLAYAMINYRSKLGKT
jgi:transposase